jgi:hypothetical protein
LTYAPRPMPGFTKEQLHAKGVTLANYILCANCNLYWHKRVFKKHLNVPPSVKTTDGPPVTVIHPAWASFIDFLLKLAIKKHMKEQTERIARGEPRVASPSESPALPPQGPRALTVDEAALRFGVTRESILAEFEKHAVPLTVKIPASGSQMQSEVAPRADRRASRGQSR